MQHPFVSLWEKPSRLVVGLMSGTSADGVDAALTRIAGSGLDSRVEQLGFYFQPFDDATRQEILAVCGGDFGGSREICLLGTHLGKLYAQAVRELLKKTGTERIDLIGCHGQTVWHIPEQTPYLGGTVRGTLQIGDPSYLAEEFGCPVVSDFRIRDMAAGGLGAPLVPYTEFLLYRSETEDVALQNIGGIGNVTLLPAGCTLEEVTAFDTGPGNMVMDALVSRITDGNLGYDDGGKLAASRPCDPGAAGPYAGRPLSCKEAPQDHRPGILRQGLCGCAAGLWRLSLNGCSDHGHPVHGGIHCRRAAAIRPPDAGPAGGGRRRKPESNPAALFAGGAAGVSGTDPGGPGLRQRCQGGGGLCPAGKRGALRHLQQCPCATAPATAWSWAGSTCDLIRPIPLRYGRLLLPAGGLPFRHPHRAEV